MQYFFEYKVGAVRFKNTTESLQTSPKVEKSQHLHVLIQPMYF